MPRTLSEIVGHPFPTTIAGSFPRPSWYQTDLRDRDFREAMRDATFGDNYRDAVRVVVGDQIDAGVDIPTDGYLWYDRHQGVNTSFLLYPANRFEGLTVESEMNPLVPAWGVDLLAAFADTINKVAVTGQISRGPLRTVDLWQVAQKVSPRMVKYSGGMGPANLAGWVTNEHYADRKAMYRDLADVYNAEYKDAVAAGVEVIHVDDVGFTLHQPEDYPLVLDTLNRAFEGVDAFRIFHSCHLASGAPIGSTPYAAFHEMVAKELDVEAVEYAFAETGFLDDDFRRWADFPSDKGLGIGVVDIKRLVVDSPEEIVAGIRRALEYIDADRIHLTTDCGLLTFPRAMAKGKLKSMGIAAEILRAEIGR
jgi:methionine synthase II (cobalamin-independent)